jgi:hypothetical protein
LFNNTPNTLLKNGAILLQTHGGEIRWRNLFVREIPIAEATEILTKKAGDGFASVFMCWESTRVARAGNFARPAWELETRLLES